MLVDTVSIVHSVMTGIAGFFVTAAVEIVVDHS